MSEKSFLRNVAQFSGTKHEKNYQKKEKEGKGGKEEGRKEKRKKKIGFQVLSLILTCLEFGFTQNTVFT